MQPRALPGNFLFEENKSAEKINPSALGRILSPFRPAEACESKLPNLSCGPAPNDWIQFSRMMSTAKHIGPMSLQEDTGVVTTGRSRGIMHGERLMLEV